MDTGFSQQAALFDRDTDRAGHAPLVIDSAYTRAKSPKTLQKLCSALDIGFTDKMLHWPAGPKPYDGIWAPHWYGAVHASTGFDGAEGALPDLPPEHRALSDKALVCYQNLATFSL